MLAAGRERPRTPCALPAARRPPTFRGRDVVVRAHLSCWIGPRVRSPRPGDDLHCHCHLACAPSRDAGRPVPSDQVADGAYRTGLRGAPAPMTPQLTATPTATPLAPRACAPS